MIAKNLITYDLTPLMTSDSGDAALAIMNIFHVKHLPIVNNEQFLGLISEDDIFEHNLEEPIGSYALSLIRPFAREKDHLCEVMAKLAEGNLTVIPVIDDEEKYLGVITQDDLMQFYAKSFSFTEPGSIVVLETTRTNYSLSEISGIVEQEGAAILGTFLTFDDETNKVYVTLKINKTNIQHILASFQRYDYGIAGSFFEEEYFDGLKSRYDALMSYLNV